jgi:transcriptional regulator GlxA family with amidase domain
MNPITSRQTEHTVCFVLLPHVHLLDLAGPAQVFYEATQLGLARYRLVYAGFEQDLSAEQGLRLTALQSPDRIGLGRDDLIVVAGIDFRTFAEGKLQRSVARLRPWLKQQAAAGVPVASICSGALVLAEAGLLDGRKCTTHWKCIDYMQQHYPKIIAQSDQLYVHDRGVYTSAGMTAGIDMALSLLEQAHGPVVSAKVAREMVVYLRRSNDDTQQSIYLDYQTHFNPAIHRVQDHILTHPHRDFTLEELAEVGNLSVRNLTRLFKKATGHTIVQFKNTVKVEVARALLHNASFSTEEVAARCGFASARQLRRVWRQHTGLPLKKER